MPLLKGRFVVPLEPKLSIEQKDTVYTIEHTEEKFTSKEYPFLFVLSSIEDGGALGNVFPVYKIIVINCSLRDKSSLYFILNVYINYKSF